jgi:hypothetical protein
MLRQALMDRLGTHPNVGDIRGRGLFQAVEFVADRQSRTPFPSDMKIHERVKGAALEAGVGIYPTAGTVDGSRGDHAIIAPPFNVTAEEIGDIVERVGRAVTRVFSHL